MGGYSCHRDLSESGDFALHTAEVLHLAHRSLRKVHVQPLKTYNCLLRNRVDRQSGIHGKYARKRSFLSKAAAHYTMYPAFFDVDQREYTIRGKGHLRLRLLDIVFADIRRAAFLIGAKDQADALFQGDAAFPDGPHGIKRAHRGTLVVGGSPAVNPAAPDHRLKGFRNRPALSAQIGSSDIMIIIPDRKACPLADLQSGIQRIKRAVSERLALLIRALDRSDTAEIHDILKHLILVRVNPFIYFLVHLLFPFCEYCSPSFSFSKIPAAGGPDSVPAPYRPTTHAQTAEAAGPGDPLQASYRLFPRSVPR